MKLLRRANNWTQEDAVKRCNTNQKMYWNWENGVREFTIDEAKKIALIFNTTV